MNAVHTFKKLAAVFGLLLITPIALQLLGGSITPADAGIRAVALFGGVLLVRRLANLAPTPGVVVVEPAASAEKEAESV